MKRLANDSRNLRRIFDEVAVRDDGVRDAGDVGFLKRIFAQHRGDRLPGEYDDGHGVHLRGEEAGHGVRGARS